MEKNRKLPFFRDKRTEFFPSESKKFFCLICQQNRFVKQKEQKQTLVKHVNCPFQKKQNGFTHFDFCSQKTGNKQ
jgi:hypothetical protein